MLKKSLAVLSLMMLVGGAQADCVDTTSVADVRKAYAEGETFEKAGRPSEAVRAYLLAQNYVCGEPNPVKRDAAQKAAPIALKLAQEQERKQNLLSPAGRHSTWERYGAFEWYEAGGYYAQADRVLMTALRAKPDDTSLFDQARQHFSDRALESFFKNNEARLAAAGAYSMDRKLYDEVLALPARNLDNILKDETKAFSEEYLREVAALDQKRPVNPLDFVAIQQAEMAEQSFRTKWRQDPIENSLDLLENAREWSVRMNYESGAQDAAQAKIRQRAVERGDLLVKQYASAPTLLERSLDYYNRVQDEAKVAAARKRAEQLGDDAMAKSQFNTAMQFYYISGNSDKAEAASARHDEQLSAQTAPMIDQYQQQAEAMRENFSDPAKIEAMRKRAEEMSVNLQKSEQQQQQFQQEQDALEEELGL